LPFDSTIPCMSRQHLANFVLHCFDFWILSAASTDSSDTRVAQCSDYKSIGRLSIGLVAFDTTSCLFKQKVASS
jgi:hypothetical protein